jgi:RNA polymerase sigma-70 factor (ECF subfamily)
MSEYTASDLVPLIPKLRRRARRLTRGRSESEDLLQDTLLLLCRRLQANGSVDDLGAYAMQALTNQFLKRRQRPNTEELDEDMAATEPVAFARLDCAETLAAIRELPDPQREVLEQVISGETSPAKIADSLNLPSGTVMSRLARARARLRKKREVHPVKAPTRH